MADYVKVLGMMADFVKVPGLMAEYLKVPMQEMKEFFIHNFLSHLSHLFISCLTSSLQTGNEILIIWSNIMHCIRFGL